MANHQSLKWIMALGVVLIAVQVGAEVDKELFLKGVKDELSGGPLLMSDNEINKMLKVFMAEQKMKQAEWKRKQAELKAKQRQNATKTGPGSPAPIATDNTRP